MDAFGCFGINASHKVLIDLFGNEGNKGSRKLCKSNKNVVKNVICALLVFCELCAPISLTVKTDVPVGKFVCELGDRTGSFGDAVCIKIGIDLGNKCIQLGNEPTIHNGVVCGIAGVLLGIKSVDVGIENKERIGVPKSTHELSLALVNGIFVETAGKPGSTAGAEIPTNSVCALLVKNAPRVNNVALVLGHLKTVFVANVTKNDAVSERCFVEKEGGNSQKSIEPTTGLVDSFTDEVCREVSFKEFLVFKGIVILGEGHGAGVEPAVDNLGSTAHLSAAFRAGKDDVVDVCLVELDIFGNLASVCHLAKLSELCNAAYGVSVSAGADPDGKGRAPVTGTGKTPVDIIFEEVAHTAFLDIFGVPVDGAVVCNKSVADLGGFDEPGIHGVVKKGRVASPAEGIAVLKLERFQKKSAGCKLADDLFVAILAEYACPGSYLGSEASAGVNKLNKRKSVLTADASVVFAECRSDVNDTRTVGEGYEVACDYVPCLFLGRNKVVKRLVLHAKKLFALVGSNKLVFLANNASNKGGSHDHSVVADLNLGILLCLVNGKSNVGRKSPGSCCPCNEITVFKALNVETDENRSFLNVLIALCNLVAGKAGSAARAIGNDLMTLIDKTLVRDLLDCPPFRLDVGVMIGNIGVVHIAPVTNCITHAAPFVGVLPDALLALFAEGFDAVTFDILLAVELQKLFNFDLNGKTLGVPTGFTVNNTALHGLVTGNNVLHNTGKNMTDMGLTVSRRRSVIECEAFSAATGRNALCKNVVLLPELGNFLLAGKEVQVALYFFVNAHQNFPFIVKIKAPPQNKGAKLKAIAVPPFFESLPNKNKTFLKAPQDNGRIPFLLNKSFGRTAQK